jgi:Putative transposase
VEGTLLALAAEEFIRRFLLHVLPKGFVRIRHYGWMANRCRRERAALCRELLGQEAAQPATISLSASAPGRRFPFCGGVVEVIEMIVPRELSRTGEAKDVKSIRHSGTLLLAGQAGQGARMPEVCAHARIQRESDDSRCRRRRICHSELRFTLRKDPHDPTRRLVQKYRRGIRQWPDRGGTSTESAMCQSGHFLVGDDHSEVRSLLAPANFAAPMRAAA